MRSLFSLLSPGGTRGRLSILIFHRVLSEPDALLPEEIDVSRFDEICRWVCHWFNVLPLSEAIERLYRKDLPARAMAITFDDGYSDNLTVALPVLKRHGLPCTVFVATGFLNGGCMWNDVIIESVRCTRLQRLDLRGLGLSQEFAEVNDTVERRQLIGELLTSAKYLEQSARDRLAGTLACRAEVEEPRHLMLTSEQVRALHRDGVEIGAHTVSHPILTKLSRSDACGEIVACRSSLEDITASAVRLFAYPNGKPGTDYDHSTMELIRETGFSAALSTKWGISTAQTDRFELPRFTPWDRTRAKFGLRLVRNFF